MDAPPFDKSLLHPRYWLVWLAMGLWRLTSLLPYRLMLPLGRALGRLLALVAVERRTIVARNLALCFPDWSEAERRQLLRRNFENYGIALFEVPLAWWASARRFRRLSQVEGLEHLENLEGRGALLMAIHCTTLEVGAQALSMCWTIDGMYRPHGNPVYDYLQRRGRVARNSQSTVYTRKDVRGVVRALRAGRVIWYAPDQDYGPKQSVFAPFFGVPAASVTATARLAEMGRAAVLPFTHERLADGSGYRVVVHPPLADFPSGDDVADATRINGIVEGFVRACPAQYLWAHRRFKTRPAGEEPVYPKRRRRRRRKK